MFELAADFVVLLHFSFIVFVLFGGLLVLKWKWVVWLHVPAALWGALIVFAGWICPLTPLENMLRRAEGTTGYATGFIEHYIIPLIYPSGLTRGIQISMGVVVIIINVIVYIGVYRKHSSLKT